MSDAPELISLKYVGDRFDGGRLPLDVLSDLPAFRDLLAAFARETWLRENADRQRVPKGFERSIAFDLVAVKDGSAVPCLRWDRDTAQAVLPGFSDSLGALVADSFGQLVNLIDEAGEGRFPASLSPGHVRALDKLGSGLREGERIEFDGIAGHDGNVVYLDWKRRRDLITHVKETYLARYEGIGRLVANQESGAILVSTENHGEIWVHVGTDAVIKSFDGNLGSVVQFSFIIELDHSDKFRSINEVSYIDLVDGEAASELDRCQARLSEIATLSEGWQDGAGLKISNVAIANARALLARRPALSGMFRIYPTLDGGVLFEFESVGWDYSVEFHANGSVEMYGVQIDGDEELSPTSFQGADEAFKAEFDARVAR